MDETLTLAQAAELVGVKKEALRGRGRRGTLEILSAGQGQESRISREELMRAFPKAAERVRSFEPEVLQDVAQELREEVQEQAQASVETAQRALAVLTQRHKEEMGEIRSERDRAQAGERRSGRLLAAATMLLGASAVWGWTQTEAVQAAERGTQEAQGARQAVSAELEGVRHELAEVVEQRDEAAAAHAQRHGQHQAAVAGLEAKIERLEGELEAREQRQDEVADFIARRMNELEAMAVEMERVSNQ